MKKNMILYHAVSTYHLLEMILYRLKNSEKEKSILMITDTLYEKFPDFEKYLEFFEDIWVYKIDISFPKGKAFQTVVNEFFDSFFKEKGIEITEFCQINAACVHYYFGHYLSDKEVPFAFFEDAAGMLSRPDILIHIEENRRPFKCKKNIERGLYDGTNGLIEKVVCNVLAQEERAMKGYTYVEDFNVIKVLMKSDIQEQEKILAFFLDNMGKVKVDDNVSVLLTQHFANLGILSFEEQKKIYQYFADYFFRDKQLLIKTHPDDVMYYNMLLKDSTLIKDRFPSEFLPILLDGNVEEISTISSTAIKNYYDCDYNIFELNTDFEKTYKSIHRYYVALRICIEQNMKVDMLCCDKRMMNGLRERNDEISSVEFCPDAEILIVDDYFNLRFENEGYQYDNTFFQLIEEILNRRKYQMVIFLNSENGFSFFNTRKGVFQNIMPVEIQVKAPTKEWWEYEDEDMLCQTIYIYTENKEIAEDIRMFSMEKELENAKQIVKVEKISDYERKAYEGQIRALERRLKYYIELCEEKRR